MSVTEMTWSLLGSQRNVALSISIVFLRFSPVIHNASAITEVGKSSALCVCRQHRFFARACMCLCVCVCAESHCLSATKVAITATRVADFFGFSKRFSPSHNQR